MKIFRVFCPPDALASSLRPELSGPPYDDAAALIAPERLATEISSPAHSAQPTAISNGAASLRAPEADIGKPAYVQLRVSTGTVSTPHTYREQPGVGLGAIGIIFVPKLASFLFPFPTFKTTPTLPTPPISAPRAPPPTACCLESTTLTGSAKMSAPSTPPPRYTRPRTPPTPLHGDAYNGLHPYKPASPPASPAPPALPQLHSERKSARTGNNDAHSSAMLPTPSKTPSLTPAHQRSRKLSMEDSARILHFQPENPNDSMPTPRDARKHKNLTASGLDDDSLDIGRPKNKKSAKSAIQIYTEVQARIPEDDLSDDNVFRDVPRGRRPSAISEPANIGRRGGNGDSPSPSRPSRSVDESDEETRMQAAVNRGEGMFYMFRGKKCFRRFNDVPDVEDAGASSREQQQLKRAVGGSANRPLTRSHVPPRLLWARSDQTSYSDEEAETDVDTSGPHATATKWQGHNSGVWFAAPPVGATPVKQSCPKRRPYVSPPTTARTTRQARFDDVPSFEQTLEADDEAPIKAPLPTPQRSSRKKKAAIDDIPVFEDDPSETAVPSTPARVRSKRNEPQLTPIVEGSEEPTSVGQTSPTAAISDRRSKRSPFDSWQRTKPGKKRGSDAVAVEDVSVKRSRSSTRSNPTRT
ncbi:hypothetical protein CERZMDRAFT_99200 [Cercospora zeae-maydis SCOH1-5]|uniref:Uncharacterized protein n=1 Tax=Cercospora zeae-maydis SCOH1-5 TaxID=717836 RepID=A0A6A6FAZ0_9PEZI|nr:hypothetical protein CERZMDRAFT_99200 [Cercospora zeae-maydis SCOH1-5]